MSNYAVIDCGTNTFHLLIAKPLDNGGFEEVFRERVFVKLAEKGIQTIGQEAYSRAVNTILQYSEIIKNHHVAKVKVLGTAALRTASNGSQLVSEIKERTGLDIQIISGDQEAQLIYKGVAQAIGQQQQRWMVMDIGGGSVEFIIVDEQGVRWFQSFPVGVAVTYKHFHKTEPISNQEITQLNTFLAGQLISLHKALLRYPVSHLVGAAGTFDVIASSLGTSHPTPYSARINLDGFQQFHDKLLKASKIERHAMVDIPDDRADMIVVAIILVQYIMKMAKIEQLTVSNFSMKEGMLAEMMV